jgi:cytoskeletal protein CcmA (bactofilin family)
MEMGFFQDLKEDLSTAVDEMETETTAEENAAEALETEEEVAVEEVAAVEEIETVVETSVEDLLEDAKVEEPTVAPLGKADILEETAIITDGMVITGDISAKGSMDLMGQIDGNIKVNGKLNVTGVINGDSEAGEVYANEAKITGQIVTTGKIKVGADSVIIGNITATTAVIAGAVKGDIDVRGPVVLDTSAIVMGNIKSKSVQINNGAVIEGLCSQCYADVSPTKFFDTKRK